MSDIDALFALRFPEEFIVEYRDGKREVLLGGKGVWITPSGDDPDGIGSISAELPKKHARNQKRCMRLVRFSELQAIFTMDGKQLWPAAILP